MSFTYAQLKTAIQDYTENTETTFVNRLDIFIKNTEYFPCKFLVMESNGAKRFSSGGSGGVVAPLVYPLFL